MPFPFPYTVLAEQPGFVEFPEALDLFFAEGPKEGGGPGVMAALQNPISSSERLFDLNPRFSNRPQRNEILLADCVGHIAPDPEFVRADWHEFVLGEKHQPLDLIVVSGWGKKVRKPAKAQSRRYVYVEIETPIFPQKR